MKMLWQNKTRKRRATERTSRNSKRLLLESLEDRRMMALISDLLVEPKITFNSTGVLTYNPATQALDISATPLLYVATSSSAPVTITGTRDFQIHAQVDNSGKLVDGVVGNDFIIVGDINIDGMGGPEYSGVLLQGEVTAFGFANGALTTDNYDFRFRPTGGALAGSFNGEIGVAFASENSSFAGSFLVPFGGGAKGETGKPVDARISLTPTTAENPVGEPHQITVLVEQDDTLPGTDNNDPSDGDAYSGFGPAPDGTLVTFSLVNSNGATATFVGDNSCIVTGGAGQCVVTINSPTAGDVEINASTTFLVFPGVPETQVTRDTDPSTFAINGPGGSGPAYKKYQGEPKIQLNKVTNHHGDDAVISPGDTVTWTYEVTNIGNAPFLPAFDPYDSLDITDDNGTPGDTSDDFSTGDNTINYVSGDDGDHILEVGETWVYEASSVAQNLSSASGSPVVIDMSGNTALNGGAGNIRTFTQGAVSVKASAFSRDKTTGAWATGYLGAYGGGLGVTDTSEDGSNNSHTVDNIGRNNYVLLEFNQSVIIDEAFLGYVVGDSDLTYWIGTKTDPFNNHQTLSDAFLSSMDFTEVNLTGSSSARTADINAGNIAGNVIVIAAQTDDTSPEDQFKIETVKVDFPQHGCYENKAVVTAGDSSDSDTSGYCNPKNPGIDIEKTTNGAPNANSTAPHYDNEDAMNGPGVPLLTPGTTVTWTYKVTNTGDLPFAFSDVVVVDDNGTPGNTSDDLKTTNPAGPTKINFSSVEVGNADNVLDPGEVWLYTATGTVQDVGSSGSGTTATFDFSGSSSLNGSPGNIRTFSAGGVSVKTSAFSRDKSTGAWSTAYLGSYGGGLGVTDGIEDGSNDTHTVDNVGRDNYVLFEYSEPVIIDQAFLGYVVNDSDLKLWVGNVANAFNNHQTLSDAFLTNLGFNEVNLTDLSTTRWADLNAGNISGNVIVIAADPGDDTPEDRFKIEKSIVKTVGCYENKGTVTAPGGLTDSDLSHYCNPTAPPPNPKIDIEKTTTGSPNANSTTPDYDNEDAANGAGVPLLTPGTTVTWTYKVTNTGNVPFDKAEVALTDDNGTPGNSSDDMTTANGKITFKSVLSGDADTALEPGEIWLYEATGAVQTLTGGTGSSITFDFSGSSATSGSAGNIRSYSAGGVSVKASAFSRTKDTEVWSTAYLGAYSGGLGVTDGSEGDGSNNMHTVDNVGRDNYVLFEFSEPVIIDSAYLGYVVNDSDLSVWIGTTNNPYANHLTLSDSLLGGFYDEENITGSSSTRTADLNSGNLAGNVLVIAGWTDDDTPEDRFKIENLILKKTQSGVYENKGVVTVPGATDSDLSHYKNSTTPTQKGSISGKKVVDVTGNGLTGDDVPKGDVTIKLYRDNGDGVRGNDAYVTSMTTGADGKYSFTNLDPGKYFVEESVPSGYVRTYPATKDYHSVSLASGEAETGKDFANFQQCSTCSITNVSYTIKRSGISPFTVSDLRGKTNEGDIVTVNFTVPSGSPAVQLSLVSYTAPAGQFDADEAGLQKVSEAQTGFFLPGTHSMTVTNPWSFYQVDFVCGPIIHKFGDAGSNVFYTPQGRLISADNDGDNLPTDTSLKSSTLIVGGSAYADNIQFNLANDPTKIAVLIGGSQVGQVSFTSAAGLPITRLIANGNAGNDTIKVATTIDVQAALYGGTGNDSLTAGGGNDYVFGEDGDDTLDGYTGRDFLVGGEGKDCIYGDSNDDILIGGTTDYDYNFAALDAIMKEWARTDLGFSSRVNHLTGASSGGYNGSYKLIVGGSSKTVEDDEDQDTLWGESGCDWFLINTDGDYGSVNDILKDKASGEAVTDTD